MARDRALRLLSPPHRPVPAPQIPRQDLGGWARRDRGGLQRYRGLRGHRVQRRGLPRGATGRDAPTQPRKLLQMVRRGRVLLRGAADPVFAAGLPCRPLELHAVPRLRPGDRVGRLRRLRRWGRLPLPVRPRRPPGKRPRKLAGRKLVCDGRAAVLRGCVRHVAPALPRPRQPHGQGASRFQPRATRPPTRSPRRSNPPLRFHSDLGGQLGAQGQHRGPGRSWGPAPRRRPPPREGQRSSRK
mmetsp:Transcript_13068/g.30887  ORF Transcript_13068/g.30887 Transcript_13068/m.30887 type:complete len:242 (-) Transcript_13068:178-903(-)